MSMYRVFIAVCGMSPQIVTESLYALARKPEPWYADEVFLISTKDGADRADLTLLRDKRLESLCRDHQIPMPVFDLQHILVIKDDLGFPLADIRSQSDNEAAADCMTELLQKYCAQTDTELHVSMAGGRKTMGFHIGYALSMLGRPQDRLSHVLVSDPFDQERSFFYPAPESKVVMNDRLGPLDFSEAEVTLVEIPFVRLRTHLAQDVLPEKMHYSTLVRKIDDLLQQKDQGIRYDGKDFYAAHVRISLSPELKAVYFWILSRMKYSLGPLCFSKSAENGDRSYAEEFLRHYNDVVGEFRTDDRVVERIQKYGWSIGEIAEKITRINKALITSLGVGAAEPYLIKNEGRRGKERCYLVNLRASQIQLNGAERSG